MKNSILKSSIGSRELSEIISIQCKNLFPSKSSKFEINNAVKNVLEKIEFSFKHIDLEYYKKLDSPYFNHLNSDHYCIFLYYLSNYIFRYKSNEEIATKLFLLNKALHGIDAFYNIELPSVFIVVHPLGTVLGRANYNDNMVFYQGVTIGATHEGVYPKFSGNNILYSNSSVIGSCNIGKNVIMGANSNIVNTDILENKTVLGNYPNNKYLISKPILKTIFK